MKAMNAVAAGTTNIDARVANSQHAEWIAVIVIALRRCCGKDEKY